MHIRGMVLGVFDLFHVGHLRYVNYARAQCTSLEVWVASDDLVLRNKGQLPIFSETERIEILRALRAADEVKLHVQSLDDPIFGAGKDRVS